ncbi:MAG: type IV pilus assembly protein PilM [Planctomycetota bacterium]
MAASNVCWGIEAGAGGIKAVKLQRDGDELRVLDYAVIPHKRVLSQPDVDPNDVMRVSLGALASQHDLSGARMAVSVPGHQGFTRFAKLPPVEMKKVPEIVRYEAVQQIPFPLEEVEWDYQPFQNEDSPDIEVGIFAVTKERVERQLDQFAEVGIIPEVVVLSPVAVYNAILYDLGFTPESPGTILLDVGTTSTDLIIAEGGGVWVRTFPIGGHNFTEALVENFKLTYPKAEKLKREAEQSKHARHVFQAMRPIFTDLVQDVQRSIGYYQGLHPEAKLTRLIGLGSTMRLPGLRKYLKQQLQMDVYRLEQFKRLGVDGPDAGEFQAQTLNLTTAYGLALQGLSMETIKANLMPVQRVRQQVWRRKRAPFAIAAGLAFAAGASMFVAPLLTSTKIAGAPKPQVIDAAMRDFNRLRGEAQGDPNAETPIPSVIDPPEADARIAEALDLATGNDLIASIVGDFREMLSFSETMVGSMPGPDGRPVSLNVPAFHVESFETTFMPAESGGFGGGRGRGGGNSAPSLEQDLASVRKIRVDAELRSPHPRLEEFLRNGPGRWLSENANRAGFEYHLRHDESGFATIGAGSALGGRGERTPPPGRGERTPPPARSNEIDRLAPLSAPPSVEGEVVRMTYFVVLEPAPEAGAEQEG